MNFDLDERVEKPQKFFYLKLWGSCWLMLKFPFFRIESGGFEGNFNRVLVDFDLR